MLERFIVTTKISTIGGDSPSLLSGVSSNIIINVKDGMLHNNITFYSFNFKKKQIVHDHFQYSSKPL